MEILEVKNINKRYGDNIALADVSISVRKGQIFGLLGPNGAGKSTLIRIITQIIKADEGEVYVNGELLKQEHIGVIGYLPEERGLYKKMKVGEQLIYLARLKGMSSAEAKEKIKAWIKKFEITEWWDKKVEDLSKGMQQKIQFISTVMHKPDLIILDEPFSGFDPINANLIKDEILQLRDEGASIIFSTHRMESVEELCDHIALIDKSKKILDGPKTEIKETFRSNTYILEYQGEAIKLAEPYEIREDNLLEANVRRAVIKDHSGHNPNALLKHLIGKAEIRSFVEKIPSMNDIFIAKVNEVKNHG